MEISAVSLTVQSEDGTLHNVIVDIPMRVGGGFAKGGGFANKEVLERAQLEKFRLDFLLRFGSVPFEAVRRGGNPPDFTVEVDGKPVGLDCAALALAGRRNAEALFARLVKRLTGDGSHAWPNLAGCDVSINFSESGGRPPGSHDRSLDEQIEAALTSIVVDRAKVASFHAEVARSGFPKQLPADVIPQYNHDRFHIVAFSNRPWRPGSPVAEALGFNLLLHFSVTLTEVESEVRRLVASHDKPGTRHLLLCVGGPDVNGFLYPGEEVLGQMLSTKPMGQLQTNHIDRVTAHMWDSGNIVELPVVPVSNASSD